MPSPIEITLQLLSKSKNKAAGRLLEDALASSDETVRQSAGREMVSSRGVKGLTDLIQRYDPSDEGTLQLFADNRDKMVPALRSVILGNEEQASRNAFRIMLSNEYFEMIPTLLTIFSERGDRLSGDSPLSEVILHLIEKYIQALENRRQRKYMFGVIMPDIVKALSQALIDHHRTDPPLILNVFLMLFPYFPEEQRDIAKVLRNPSLPAYLSIYKILLSENPPQAFRFVYHCLDNLDPPQLALSVFAKRHDIAFLERMFKAIGEHLSQELIDNLKRIQRFEWLDQLRVILAQLDEIAQRGFVLVVNHSQLSPEERTGLLFDIFRYTKSGGRLAVLETLASEPGERIDHLVWQACDDPSPDVQAEALKLLRQRDLPKASLKILQYAASPHDVVRNVVQHLLPEFRFGRFIDMFDQLGEEQRQAMFKMVKRIDPNLVEEITYQFENGDMATKAKTLLCIEYGELVPTFEESLCTMLMKESNATLRGRAAKLLAAGHRELSRSTLVQAFHRDASPDVRAIAKESLENRPTPWEVK